MKKKQDNSQQLSQQLDSVLEQLTSDSVESSALADVATQLNNISVVAGSRSQEVVQRGAELLSLVSELAAEWDNVPDSNADDKSKMVAFLQDGVLVLDDAVASGAGEDNVESLIEFASENWAEYLSFFDNDSFGSTPTKPDWGDDDSPDQKSSADGPANETTDEQEPVDGQQIAMLLQALQGSSDTDSEESADDQAPPRQPVQSGDSDDSGQQQTPTTATFAAAGDNNPSQLSNPTANGEIPLPDPKADQAAIKELADDPEMLDAYLDDALRCVASMEQAAMQIEQDSSDREPARQFCRELHTLKGASATVGLSELAAYLHELETSLENIFGDEAADLDAEPLFLAVDQVRNLIESLSPTSDPAEPQSTANVSATNVSRPTADFSTFAGNDDASIRIRASRLDRLMDMLAELVVLRNRQESDVAEFDELNEELSRCAARVSVADDHQMLPALADSSTIQLPAAADTLLGRSSPLLGEVSKDIAAVSQGLRDLQKPIMENNVSISMFIRDFRQEIMQLRRAPVLGMFTRLQRAARDAAKTEEKKVQVRLVGENAGLEQEIQERLFEPMLHVVRNSVSHGIESEPDRIKAGKEAVGTITLEASSNAQLLIIEVHDDGGGIDYDAVSQRAIEKGLISAGQEISREQLGKLIFHPGFSTKQTASSVSGRGVGMDVVANTVNQLKGRIEVDSQRGQGTTIRLLIPLKSGIEHVMVFRCGQQLFALPMQAVSSAKRSGDDNAISINNIFSIEAQLSAEAEILHIRPANASRNGTDTNLAISVDELLGPEEVVVRKLPNLLHQHPLFNGVTLSGAGQKVLLLDAQEFAVHCRQSTNDSGQQPGIVENSDDQKRVLIVDDSLTARRGLSKLMRGFNFHVTEAGDGVAAVDTLRKQTFDLVLTDLDMPRMGGLELLTDINNSQYCDAPKVVVSSRNEATFREQALEAGATDYITKPASKTSIEQLLNKLSLLDTV